VTLTKPEVGHQTRLVARVRTSNAAAEQNQATMTSPARNLGFSGLRASDLFREALAIGERAPDEYLRPAEMARRFGRLFSKLSVALLPAGTALPTSWFGATRPSKERLRVPLSFGR
jgi:hypothetical protein